jgi:hypothetical protein
MTQTLVCPGQRDRLYRCDPLLPLYILKEKFAYVSVVGKGTHGLVRAALVAMISGGRHICLDHQIPFGVPALTLILRNVDMAQFCR